MTDLFLEVLNSSFATSWLVLAVILVRLLLKKAPRSLVCGLWALVALRLIFGGIEAPFSLLPSDQIIPPESLFEQAPAIHSGVPILDNAINPVYTESLRPTAGASVNPLQVWLAVFANLWILGAAAMTLWAVNSWLRVRRQVRESIPTEDGVFLCDRIGSPFIFGLFRPRIYLPSDLSAPSSAHVIAHEKAHLARRDHWWKPLGFALLTVNWFNPAMWLAYILLCRDIEMACDEKVVLGLTLEDKKAYSAALLRCSVNSRRITACPLAFGEVGVKQRVKSVLNYKRPAFWVILAAAGLTIVLAVGLLTSPAGESEPAEICWGGNLYVQSGEPVDFVPDKQQTTGVLKSILADSQSHPTQHAQAIRLDQEYIGQSLVQVGYALYLQEPGGEGWLPFRMLTGSDALLDSAGQDGYLLNLHQGSLYGNEVLTGSAADSLTELLRALAQQQMTPGPMLDWQQYADDSDARITIQPEQTGSSYELFRTTRHGWFCLIRDIESGDSDWYFNGSSLDSFLLPYESELKQVGSSFPRGLDTSLSLDFRTAEKHGVLLRAGIPCLEQGDSHIHWEWESLQNAAGFRCRPMGRQDWMEVRFYDTEDTLYYYYTGIQSEPITLISGATGTLYHPGDPNRWDLIALDTARGQLNISTPDTFRTATDWIAEDYRMARAIVETIGLYENGTSLLTAPSKAGEPNLGIHLSVENLTPEGATLVCTQDGRVMTPPTSLDDCFGEIPEDYFRLPLSLS